MTNEIPFGEWLRKQRRALDLTRQALADQVGCAEITLRRIEKGTLKPSIELANILLEKLGIPELERPQWILFARGLAGLPTKTVDSFSNKPITNLPTSLTTFIGREKEQAEIIKQIKKHRLITLTGPGGVGKTRLSIKVGEQASADYVNGVWLIELAALNDPALLPQTVMALFGIAAQPNIPHTEILINFLRAKNILLILDNCEHLLEACAHFADTLLKNCASLKILATSRESLGITGEAAYPVPSLGLPDLEQLLENFRGYESVRLFEERAQLAKLDFSLTLENASSIAQICHSLDGIPLAIELAAAHVNMFSTEQIATQLNESFNLLTGGSRTALPRQQTIRASIDWSWNLLSDSERILLRRLSVFAGGWIMESAESVCIENGIEKKQVADLISQLVAKSLVVANQASGRARRYHLLETIRQYALAKLVAHGEADIVRRRHAIYYLSLAEVTRASNISTQAWLDKIVLEHDNLRASLMWSQSDSDSTQLGLHLTIVIDWFWGNGYVSEAISWLEGVLANTVNEQGNDTMLRARTLGALGGMQTAQGDYEAGEAHLAHGLKLFQELGEVLSSANLMERLGWLARQRGDTTTARYLLEESLATFRELKAKNRIVGALNTLGEVLVMQEDVAGATRVLEESLTLSRELGDYDAIGWALNHLGHVAQIQGEYERAAELHLKSLPLFRKSGPGWVGIPWAHQGLGETALAQGDAEVATTHLSEALGLFRDLGDRAGIAWCLAGLGGVAALDEEPERAVWLWGVAETLRQSVGTREAPASRATHERLKAEVRKQLGEAVFNAKWVEGKSASTEQAIVEAIR